jgi:uncharacterized protein
MADETTDRLRRAYAAFSAQQDLPWDMFDPAIEHDQRGGLFLDGVFYGIEGLRAGLEQIQADWEDLRFEIEDVIDLGGRYLVNLRMRARVRDSEAELDAQVAHIWEFRDGRAVRWASYGSHEAALRAVGTTGAVETLH